MIRRASQPNVYWVASPRRARVRHAAEKITTQYERGHVFARAVCGVWRVWATAENDFENMHQCGRCWDVIRDPENSERFFSRGEGSKG
jgi:hypothetical protein